jgi:hypothetical protein
MFKEMFNEMFNESHAPYADIWLGELVWSGDCRWILDPGPGTSPSHPLPGLRCRIGLVRASL